MKAVIMAAGKGVRMLPLTKTIPKVLVEVNGRPFLWYVIDNLHTAGITDICLIVSYKKEKIAEFLKKYDIKAEMIEQKVPQGTGQAVSLAKSFTKDDDFIVLGGDNLWSPNDIKRITLQKQALLGLKVANPEKYGVLVVNDRKLVRIHEKPKEFVGDLINTGLYKFTSEIYNCLAQIKLSERGEYELTDALGLLAQKENVAVITIKDYWLDLGTIADIEKIEKFLREKEK